MVRVRQVLAHERDDVLEDGSLAEVRAVVVVVLLVTGDALLVFVDHHHRHRRVIHQVVEVDHLDVL